MFSLITLLLSFLGGFIQPYTSANPVPLIISPSSSSSPPSSPVLSFSLSASPLSASPSPSSSSPPAHLPAGASVSVTASAGEKSAPPSQKYYTLTVVPDKNYSVSSFSIIVYESRGYWAGYSKNLSHTKGICGYIRFEQPGASIDLIANSVHIYGRLSVPVLVNSSYGLKLVNKTYRSSYPE